LHQKPFSNQLKDQSTEILKWRSRGGLDDSNWCKSFWKKQQQHQPSTAVAPNDNRISIFGVKGITNVYRNNWGTEHTVLLLNHI